MKYRPPGLRSTGSASIPPEIRYELGRLEERGRRQSIAVASSFVVLVDLRDRYTGGHSSRVASMVREIGMRMALNDDELEIVVTSASLHDVGKIGVSDQVLLKPSRLAGKEFDEIKKHPEYGWMVLRDVEGLEEASLIVLHHHERWDGGGYPGGLAGDAIPLGSRIIAVADSHDAMTTDRPYRRAWNAERALGEIERSAGSQFDPLAVEAFLDCMANRVRGGEPSPSQVKQARSGRR